jgi:riboflavin kinase
MMCVPYFGMLGIPTANLDVTPLRIESDSLAPGIYFGWAGLRGAQAGVFGMVMSIGWNPFFHNASKTIEPWLLHDFPEDFYDQVWRWSSCQANWNSGSTLDP